MYILIIFINEMSHTFFKNLYNIYVFTTSIYQFIYVNAVCLSKLKRVDHEVIIIHPYKLISTIFEITFITETFIWWQMRPNEYVMQILIAIIY